MKQEYKLMAKIMACTMTAIIGGSMLTPLLALRLKHLGYSQTSIGLFASMSWVGMLAFAPYVARLAEKFGYRKIYIITGFISLGYALLVFFSTNYYVWAIASFLIGFVWVTRWVTTESYINEVAPAATRGKFIGLYGSLIGTMITIGPALLLVTGTETALPFYASIAFFTISLVLSFLVTDVKGVYDKMQKTKLTLRKFAAKNKFLFAAAFLGGVFENGLNSISLLYGLSLGLVAAKAAIIISCIGIGALLVQYPAGIIADKFKGRNHYLTLSVILLIANIGLFFAPGFTPLVFFAAFCWGIYGPAIYVLIVSHLGSVFKKGDLIAVTSFVIFSYTLGGITAPIIGGITLDIMPIYGLPLVLTTISLAMLIFTATDGKKQVVVH